MIRTIIRGIITTAALLWAIFWSGVLAEYLWRAGHRAQPATEGAFLLLALLGLLAALSLMVGRRRDPQKYARFARLRAAERLRMERAVFQARLAELNARFRPEIYW